jgi:hypothetical protein
LVCQKTEFDEEVGIQFLQNITQKRTFSLLKKIGLLQPLPVFAEGFYINSNFEPFAAWFHIVKRRFL